VIAAVDQQFLARCRIPSGRIVVHAAVADVHAVNETIAERTAALAYSAAHAGECRTASTAVNATRWHGVIAPMLVSWRVSSNLRPNERL
jgi:hypothetical protein